MSEIVVSVEHLRTFIGCKVTHEGAVCQVIEILEDGPTLILQNQEHATTIQPDQLGEAHRRVPLTYTVPVLNDECTALHAAFLALELELELLMQME